MMNQFRNALWPLAAALLAVAVFTACDKTEEKKEEQPATELKEDLMVNEYRLLQQGVDTTWNTMIADDDEKLFHLKRLLEEVSYTGQYDKELYESLSEQVAQLKSERYDQRSMGNSNRIDLYDEATRMVVREVVAFARNNPKYEQYPLMEDLILDIEAAEDRVLFYRVDYDSAAKAYNRFIQEHTELVKEIDSTPNLQPLPLFEIQE